MRDRFIFDFVLSNCFHTFSVICVSWMQYIYNINFNILMIHSFCQCSSKLAMSENRLRCIIAHSLSSCPCGLLKFFRQTESAGNQCSYATLAFLISHLLVLRTNQTLISSVTVLPSGSVMLYYMLIAQLFCLPQHVPHREHTQ